MEDAGIGGRMHRDDDTRPIRPAAQLRNVMAPDYVLTLGVAKSLWVNDVGLVSITLIAEADDKKVQITIFGPGLIPVRVKQIISEGTTAADILALHG